jgi:hypothetical protein
VAEELGQELAAAERSRDRGVAVAEGVEDRVDQHRDVTGALAQRRQADDEHREPVVEVGAEAVRVDLGVEVTVARGDDPDVDGTALGAADALDLAAIDGAEELGLEVERELADLVEEQGAARRRLERADAGRAGAGEGAGLVAEQLGLEQVRRDRAAVDDHERAVAARALEMQRLGGELLAGAALALEEHGGVGRRGGLEEREGGAHRDRRAAQQAETVAWRQRDLDVTGADAEAKAGPADRELGAVAERRVEDRRRCRCGCRDRGRRSRRR